MKYLKPNSNYCYIADNQSNIDSKRDYKDNNRRGDYVPSYKKYEDQPIRFSKPRTNDLQPIMLGGGQEPLPLNNAPYQPNFINNQRVPIAQNRNNAVGREGVFRNRIIARNEIPKAG